MACCRNRSQICTITLSVLQFASLQRPAGALTLARKLDNVHINTVNSNKIIPNVRLATPCSPKLPRKVPLLALSDEDLDTPWASSGTDPDCDCRRDPAGSPCWGASSAGITGSVGAIFSRHCSLHPRVAGIKWPRGDWMRLTTTRCAFGGGSRGASFCTRLAGRRREKSRDKREAQSPCTEISSGFRERATETITEKREPSLTWICAGRCRGQVGVCGGA